jgi:hypothetical protein
MAPPKGLSLPYYISLGFRQFGEYTQELDVSETGEEHPWTAVWVEKILD